MKTFSTGSNPEDADDENVDVSSLENQGQFVLKFGFATGGIHSNITAEEAASIRRSLSRPWWRLGF
jgi:hypothetical protein